MINVILIHGFGGNNKENWFPWLKKELQNLEHKVISPSFPNPSSPNLGQWLDYLQTLSTHFTNDSILVGHSLGVPFILSILETHKVKAAFLVAGFSELPKNKFSPKMTTFIKQFNWDKIKENCSKFEIFHSDNDPYVPIELAENLANNLDSKLTVIEGGAHLNSTSGYKKFYLLLEKIKEYLN